MRLIKKITLFFRRMRLVRLIVSVSAAISATVLLLPMYVIVLPIMLALTGLTAFSSLFFASRMNRRLRAELAGRHLYVFAVSDESSLKAGSFFCGKWTPRVYPNMSGITPSHTFPLANGPSP